MGVEEIADELYGLAPGEFVAARQERVAAARAAGDRELAAAVGKLARPTVPAWLVNLLVRAEPEQLGELLDLGAALRDVQAAGTGEELRRLSTRRHALIAALARRADDLAGAAGRRVSDDAGRAVVGTLEATVADPDAASAVRAGRLVRALSYAGWGPVDLSPAMPAAPARTGRPGRRGQGGRWPAAALPGQESAGAAAPGERREPRARPATMGRVRERDLDAARGELAKAERELADVRRRAAARESEVAAARDRLADVRRRSDDLAALLDQARQAVATAHDAVDQAEQDAVAASALVRAAEARRSLASAAVAQLGEPTDSPDR